MLLRSIGTVTRFDSSLVEGEERRLLKTLYIPAYFPTLCYIWGCGYSLFLLEDGKTSLGTLRVECVWRERGREIRGGTERVWGKRLVR